MLVVLVTYTAADMVDEPHGLPAVLVLCVTYTAVDEWMPHGLPAVLIGVGTVSGLYCCRYDRCPMVSQQC